MLRCTARVHDDTHAMGAVHLHHSWAMAVTKTGLTSLQLRPGKHLHASRGGQLVDIQQCAEKSFEELSRRSDMSGLFFEGQARR